MNIESRRKRSMRRVFVVALGLALVATLGFADGPETGIVTGQVTDASGAPLPGVTVTLSR